MAKSTSTPKCFFQKILVTGSLWKASSSRAKAGAFCSLKPDDDDN
jgi:hypothetical protein